MAASRGRAGLRRLTLKITVPRKDLLMSKNSSRPVGRHFLQIPGPTPLPDRVLRAMDTPIIDHRGPEFAKLAKRCLDGIKTIFKTTSPVIIYTATGTGAWEAALVNTLSPGDRVLMVETGQFATLWKTMAEKIGLTPEFIKTDWRIGADPAAIEDHLRKNMNKIGFFPYTPATQMLHGLAAGIDMLHEEGLDNVFARHHRLAEATRRAVRAWGLEIMCRDPTYYSPTITAVMLPEGHDADAFRNLALDTFNISYGTSFGRYSGKYFRIGHLGDINDGYLMGALATTEMALALAGVPYKKGGVQAAIDYLISAHAGPARAAA